MATNATKTALDHSLLHLLHRVGQCAQEQFTLQLGATGLTPRQYAILLVLSEHDNLHQSQIVERTGIDRSTVSATIKRLLVKGLVQRKRGAFDARNNDVQLSNNGRQMVKASTKLAESVDQRLLSFMAPRRREQFLQDLHAIIHRLN